MNYAYSTNWIADQENSLAQGTCHISLVTQSGKR